MSMHSRQANYNNKVDKVKVEDIVEDIVENIVEDIVEDVVEDIEQED